MAIPTSIIPVLKDLVHDLVGANFDKIEGDGRMGRLDRGQLAAAIQRYGRQLVEVPDEGYDSADSYEIRTAATPSWGIDLDLWTAEEGHSDLTLSVTVSEPQPGTYLVEIDDLHVL